MDASQDASQGASQPPSFTRVHFVVRGIVQGVFFRAATRTQARRLAVTGWVANRADGSVEVVAEGPRAALEDLVTWSRRGPSGARVDDVSVRWESYAGEFADFTISH